MLETDSKSGKGVYDLLHVIRTKDGKSNMYEHLQKLYETKVDMNDDKKFLDLIEDISIRIKTQGSYFSEEKSRESLLNYLEEFEKNAKGKKALLGPMIKVDPNGGDPETITQVTFVPEYHNIFQTLEWVGISIGEKESYLLTNSLRNLASNKNLPNGVSFWGKIYGTERDYYLAEAAGVEPQSTDGTQPELLDLEKRNEDGVNKNTFYVTSDLTGEWTELPDVRPDQIRASRKIRYIFSGNLKKGVVSNPHFPGTEKELLRCMIARILHGTKLEPSMGHWKISDEESPFKPLEKNEEETKIMSPNDLLDLKNWIHFLPGIIQQGRVSHYIEYPEDVDQDEFKKKVLQKDPFDKRIKSASEDSTLISSIPRVKISPWKIQYFCDDKVFTNPNIKLAETEAERKEQNKDNTANYSVICIRSLRWPGAYNIRFKNENYFFYFGWGQKFADYTMGEKHVYQDFPVIPKDINDYEDFPEPNSPPHEEENNADDKKDNPDQNDDS